MANRKRFVDYDSQLNKLINTVELENNLRVLELFDDFINGTNAIPYTPSLTGGSINTIAVPILGRVGALQYGVTSSGNRASLTTDLNCFALGDGSLVYQTDINIPILSATTDEFKIRLGISNNNGSGTPTFGVFFEYDRTISTFWRILSINNGTTSFFNTTLSVTANTWYKIRLEISQDNSTITFYSNNTIIGSFTGNTITGLPSAMGIVNILTKSSGTTLRTFLQDYIYFRKIFNITR